MPPSGTHETAMEDQDEGMKTNYLQVGGFVTPQKSSMSQTENNDNSNEPVKQKIIWLNVISITLYHIIAVYMFIAYTIHTKLLSILWGFIVGIIGGFGITAGAHRLWSHRSYKAKPPLQLLLMFCFAVSGQNSIYDWVRDHRVHHKFSETDADPHNSKRGFFFSHVGWLMLKKHPEVLRKGRMVDMSDITNDPWLSFHTKYFTYIKLLSCFVLPVIVPVYCWNETWKYAIASQAFVRYVLNLNFTWSVNSVAHIWGNKPYDKRIMPVENIGVSIVALGEGWHNYHHVFPWDYKAAELGSYTFNLTTMLLDFFAKIGWAYDMKSPSPELVQRTIEKYGDGSHIPEIPDPEKKTE